VIALHDQLGDLVGDRDHAFAAHHHAVVEALEQVLLAEALVPGGQERHAGDTCFDTQRWYLNPQVAQIGVSFFGGLQSEMKSQAEQQGKNLVTFIVTFIKGRAPGSLVQPDNAQLVERGSVAADDWSGVWKIYPDNGFAFIVDDGVNVRWFFEAPCCTHVFVA